MQLLYKVCISVCVIVFCTKIVAKVPSLAGLVAVMPLTGLLVLVWAYVENQGNPEKFAIMADYAKGAIWGIVPTMLFFGVAFFCFRRQLSLWIVLSAGFSVWVIGAVVHQWLLHK